jgi:6-phospho-beta-glucosidase
MAVKLALIGGGGVRAPLFVQSALRRAARLDLSEIALMDTGGDQLERIGALCAELGRRAGGAVRITATTSAEAAFDGADFVVTTVRPGGVDGRIADERIALDQNVLGQETTGPGGFAMALRSIPTILGYARLLRRISPQAWLFNFTNPAGLVTQALSDAGIERCVGICDSANGAQAAVARWLGVDEQAVETDVFGLNHLSFSR